MKTSKLLIAAVLAIAIGAPIVGFVGDINMAQPTTAAGNGSRSFTGLLPACCRSIRAGLP